MSAPPPRQRQNPSRSSKIGDSADRIEDERLLRGRGTFIDDVDVGYGTVHIAFLRSDLAHARIIRIDTTATRALPSVLAVFTAADFPDIKPISADFDAPGFVIACRPVLASERVRFVGDAIAMVVAADAYAAADAIETIDVELESLSSVVHATDALKPGAPALFEHVPNNVIYVGTFELPKFASEHANAEIKIKETFSAARVAAVPIEPRGCVASFQSGTQTLTLWSSTQSPHLVRTIIAEYLKRPESDVRVISTDVGGGFGAKTVVYPEEILVCAAALRLGRPIKWIEDRYEDMLTSAQARDHVYEVEAGFDNKGVVTSLSADILVNIGAYPSLPMDLVSKPTARLATCQVRIG